MSRRFLVVGQAPSASSDPLEPLAGPCGRRLASLCGLSLDEWLSSYRRVNLIGAFPGKARKGDAWTARERLAAAEVAGRIHEEARPGSTVVLLGGNVVRAFRRALAWERDPTLFLHLNVARRYYWACPHPSGVNLFWNDPFNVGQARSLWLRVEEARR